MIAFGVLQTVLAPFFAYHFFLRRPRVVVPYGNRLRQHAVVFPPAPRPGACTGTGTVVTTTLVVSGGAWMLSSTAWGWPLVRALAPAGHAVALLGHRQFPFATASEQVADVVAAVKAIAAACPAWGGSQGALQLVGQSAGAHLAALAALALAREAQGAAAASAEACAPSGGGALPAAPPLLRLRALVLCSGVYDLPAFLPVLREKGLPQALLGELFECPGSGTAPARLSPRCLVADEGAWGGALGRWLPPTTLLHGARDKAVPVAQSEAFHAALVGAGVPATLTVFPELGHTEFVIEGPAAGRDELGRALGARREETTSPLFPFAGVYMGLVSRVNPFS
jgi:acetyl esterase/lipase